MKTKNISHAVAALNLEPIKNKLMDPEHGEGWSRAKVEAMEIEYRRFLHLVHAFPNEAASPTKAVDTFWHYHILDTQKYAADCEQVFGCFMHHDPYGDEDSEPVGIHTVDRMQELYEATFGEAYIRPEAYFLDQPAGSFTAASGASVGVCHTFCMFASKKAPAKVSANQGASAVLNMLAAIPASAKAAVCHTFCMLVAKPASVSKAATAQAKPAGAKKGVCHTFCMFIAKPAQRAAVASQNCSFS